LSVIASGPISDSPTSLFEVATLETWNSKLRQRSVVVQLVKDLFVRDDGCHFVVIPSGRPCENSVHGSTWLTTNGTEIRKSTTYPFALSRVEGLLKGFYTVWRMRGIFPYVTLQKSSNCITTSVHSDRSER
jgi:hypothetical protein